MNADKIICIQTFSGRNIYVRTTDEKWKELTDGIEVYSGYMANGWRLNQDKLSRIIMGTYPEREDYQVVAIHPWRDYCEELGVHFTLTPPTPNYYIIYSSIDKPETHQ
jgi:hypothetical protein